MMTFTVEETKNISGLKSRYRTLKELGDALYEVELMRDIEQTERENDYVDFS